MQQIYSRTPMPKCDLNKVAFHFYWNRTSAWVFSCKLANVFKALFYKNSSQGHPYSAPNSKIQIIYFKKHFFIYTIHLKISQIFLKLFAKKHILTLFMISNMLSCHCYVIGNLNTGRFMDSTLLATEYFCIK